MVPSPDRDHGTCGVCGDFISNCERSATGVPLVLFMHVAPGTVPGFRKVRSHFFYRSRVAYVCGGYIACDRCCTHAIELCATETVKRSRCLKHIMHISVVCAHRAHVPFTPSPSPWRASHTVT